VFSHRLLFRALVAMAIPLTPAITSVRSEPTSFSQSASDIYDKAVDLQQKGKLEEAVKAYEEAIRLGMNDYPRAHLYKANSLLDLKSYDKAIAQYTKFLKDFSLEDSCRH